MKRKNKLFKGLSITLALLGVVVANVGRVFAANTYNINYSGGTPLSTDNIVVDPTLTSLKALYSSNMGFVVSDSNLWESVYYKSGEKCTESRMIRVWDNNRITSSDNVYFVLSGDQYDMRVQLNKIILENTTATQSNPYAVIVTRNGSVNVVGPANIFSDANCAADVYDESIKRLKIADEERVFVEVNAKLLRHGTDEPFISEGMFYGITDIDAAQSYQIRNRIASNNKSLLSHGNIYVVSEDRLTPTDPELNNMLVDQDPSGYNYIYSQYSDHTISMDEDNRVYVKLDTSTQTQGVNTVFGYANAAGSAIRFYANQATINYESDANGVISGIATETIVHGENPSGSSTTPNDHYVFSHWVADKDVTLTDDTVIVAGEPLTPAQVKQVIVSGELTFTAIHEAVNFHIDYISDDHGTISGITGEDVLESSHPSGSVTDPEEHYVLSYWVADKDVTLEDGSIITAGNTISPEALEQIVVTEDLAFTAVHEKEQLNIVYESDDKGEITGIISEYAYYEDQPSGSTTTPIEHYVLAYWAADKDVTLEDGTVITAGEAIAPEEITQIVVTENLTLTAIHEEIHYHINYTSDDSGIITGIEDEDINIEQNPTGSEATPNKGFEFDYWTADVDVVLVDGTEIKAGEPISSDQVKQIVVEQDIVLTAVYKSSPAPDAPNTGRMINHESRSLVDNTIVAIIAGILVSISSFFVLKKQLRR